MTYLTPVVPFRVDCVVNGGRSELLSSHSDNSIWIRFTFAKNANVLLHQVFRFNNVDPQNTLRVWKSKKGCSQSAKI